MGEDILCRIVVTYLGGNRRHRRNAVLFPVPFPVLRPVQLPVLRPVPFPVPCSTSRLMPLTAPCGR